jgi:hypothetical protein
MLGNFCFNKRPIKIRPTNRTLGLLKTLATAYSLKISCMSSVELFMMFILLNLFTVLRDEEVIVFKMKDLGGVEVLKGQPTPSPYCSA